MEDERATAETFTLEIALGNAAMQTGLDVANALRDAAARIEQQEPLEPMGSHDEGRRIRDENGNTVGHWRLS